MIGTSERCLGPVDVIVLAGGLGTRLASVLADRPKLLAPVGGRPFIELLIDWLTRFGAQRLVFALGHLAAVVERHLDAHARPGVSFARVIEPAPLGTAGALRLAAEQGNSDPIMVVNGDSMVDADLCAFLAAHRRAAAPLSLICTEMDDVSRYGRVEIESGRVRRFIEKDATHRGPGAINAGVYLMSTRFLRAIDARAVSLEHDVLARLPSGTAHAFTGRFPFVDIGTPESLVAAAGVLADSRIAAP